MALRNPRKPRTLPHFLTESETEALLEATLRLLAGRVRIGLGSEVNDRDSASISSDRVRLLLGYRRTLTPRWSLDGYLTYRTSRYSELAVPREEDLTSIDVAAHRAFRGGWLLDFDYRHNRNESTAAGYAYSAARVGIGVSKEF